MQLHWVTLALFAIAAWGAVGLLQKISADLLDPAALLFWVVIGLLIGALPLYLWQSSAAVIDLGLGSVLLGIGCGLVNALGSWCLFRALARGAPASIAIPLTALYPLLTVALALVFLGETLTLRQVCGALLAVFGGALLSLEPDPKAAT